MNIFRKNPFKQPSKEFRMLNDQTIALARLLNVSPEDLLKATNDTKANVLYMGKQARKAIMDTGDKDGLVKVSEMLKKIETLP